MNINVLSEPRPDYAALLLELAHGVKNGDASLKRVDVVMEEVGWTLKLTLTIPAQKKAAIADSGSDGQT